MADYGIVHDGEITVSNQYDGDASSYQTVMPDGYTGAYTVTPTQEQQTLETEGLVMTGNVVIEPIPSNYGLVTWDGSLLFIS